MAYKERHFILENILVTLLIYQGVFCKILQRSQAFVPLDDEDYTAAKERVARSSSESCETGWREYRDKCYKFFGINDGDRKTWSNSNKHCKHLHSTLVSIHDSRQRDTLLGIDPQYYRISVWIGLHQKRVGADFTWTDGSPLNFTNWKHGHPKSHKAEKSCVHIEGNHSKHWIDGSCKLKLGYICQSNNGTDVSSPYESSGDGEGTDVSSPYESSGDGEGLCADVTCENGGSCTGDTLRLSFQCICPDGYTGERCEERLECTDHVCENGGSCTVDAENAGYKCTCMDDYIGERCEEKVSSPGIDISDYVYIIGAVTAVILLIILVVVFVLFKRSRNRGKNAKDNVARSAEEKSIAMSSCKRTQSQD